MGGLGKSRCSVMLYFCSNALHIDRMLTVEVFDNAPMRHDKLYVLGWRSIFIQHAEQTRVLDNGRVEADVMLCSTFALEVRYTFAVHTFATFWGFG